MVREGMGFVALLGQFPKVAGDVVVITALGFQLYGHVFDTEVRGCAMSGLRVSSVPCGRDQGIPVATVR